MIVRAIIPAAGQGKRMNSQTPKQFLELEGHPILHHTLKAFENSDLIESIILVVPPKDVAIMKFEWQERFPIISDVVAGGKERQDSVYNGLCVLEKDTDIVIIHDGVRPFVSRSMIAEVIESAKEHGAAIAALPLNDTLKRGDSENLVKDTIQRDALWRVQTPQAFCYSLLSEGMDQARVDNFYGTDEGVLVERLGKPVKLTVGSEHNIKITRPEDLPLAKLIATLLEDTK